MRDHEGSQKYRHIYYSERDKAKGCMERRQSGKSSSSSPLNRQIV